MINKNYDLLGEQLAESGLEMSFEPITGAIISGVASIASGIFGSSQADKANRAADKAQKKAQKQLDKIAAYTNEYRDREFDIGQQNYANTRAFERETLIRNWQYQTEQQDFAFLSAIEQYGKSVQNTQDRLTYNSIAAMQAYESEQSALNDLFTEDAFTRQGMLVDQLQNEGKAALGQAGNSRGKALQSSIAALGRNSAIMDASLSSSVEQSQRNMQQIGLQRYAADLQANASMMIKPKRGPAIPLPIQAPERIFIEPMEVFAGQAPPAPQQSTFAPILSGFIQGAGQIAGGFINAGQNNYQSPVFGSRTMSAGVPLSTGSYATSTLNNFLRG